MNYGRTIKFSENKKREEVIGSIKDSGTGIDPDIFPRLFTKFSTAVCGMIY